MLSVNADDHGSIFIHRRTTDQYPQSYLTPRAGVESTRVWGLINNSLIVRRHPD